MMAIGNNIEFFTVLRSLIDAWCDRHALKPLSRVLGPYLAFDGLPDGWGEILNALKDVRALCRLRIDVADRAWVPNHRG